MKCPKCNNEVKKHQNFCPYCGTKLSNKLVKPTSQYNKKQNRVPMIIISSIVVVMMVVSTLASVGLTKFFTNNGISKIEDIQNTEGINSAVTTEKEELPPVEGEPTKVKETFESIDAFQSKYSNANDYLVKVVDYSTHLNALYGAPTTVTHIVYIFDNNNVSFVSTYKYKTETLNTKITHAFDCANTTNQETYYFQTNKVDSFDELFFTQEDLNYITQLVDQSEVAIAEQKLLDKKSEFEKESKSIGHYGFGVREENMSNIIKKQKGQYYKTLKISKDA